MEDYLALTKTADMDRVSIAAMYLKKTARRWYRTNKDSLTTFAILKTKITAHFVPANYRTQLRLKWDNLMQDKKSVSDFVLEIRTLGDKLGKDDDERVHRLTFGINSTFRKFLSPNRAALLPWAKPNSRLCPRGPCSLNRQRNWTAVPPPLRRFSLDASIPQFPFRMARH